MADTELTLEDIVDPRLAVVTVIVKMKTASGIVIATEWDASDIPEDFQQAFLDAAKENIVKNFDKLEATGLPLPEAAEVTE